MSVSVTVEPTRNENTVAFKLDKALIPPGTGSSYPNREKAQKTQAELTADKHG